MTILNKVTLISGAAKGIGAAIAKQIASEGHTVIINYQSSADVAQNLAKEINENGGKAYAYGCDISNESQVEELYKYIEQKVGKINQFVHCASPNPVPETLLTSSWESYQLHLDVQLKGAYNCLKYGLPQMIEQNEGSVLFIGTIFTHGTPPVQQSPYIVAKAALEAYAKTIAVELGPKGIRVNCIAPGMTHTEMISNIPEKSKMLAKMNTPLRKLAEPEDIAHTAAFLLSDKAKHISGETIKVCGGLVM